MSSISIATLPRLSREGLAGLMATTPLSPIKDSRIAVVDVRDSDHVGGNIAGSIHAPTPTLDYRMPELVRQLKDKDSVVFHCALSQVRGPSAALLYLRERERLIVPVSGGEAAGEAKRKQKVYVLDGGFVQWQEKYGKDIKLTEAYDEELWKDGY